MKRTILKVAIFAIIAGALVSACGKDEDDTPRNDTPTIENPSRWPEGARLTGGDSCITKSHRTLWRVDSMLSIYYFDGIVLPDGFCAVIPIDFRPLTTDWFEYGHNAAVVIFKGDREDAINKLMQVDGIYAINPVYQNVRDWLAFPNPFIDGILSGEEQVSEENVNQLMSIAEELRLRLVYFERFTNYPYVRFTFMTEYSMVNSVVASNIIKSRCNVQYVEPNYDDPAANFKLY